jgi:hypothetical protein
MDTTILDQIKSLTALSYTPQEVNDKIIKRKSTNSLEHCPGCHLYKYKKSNEWYDKDQKCIFCDECALKYGWRNEQPIDFLINNIGSCFISIKERHYRFHKFGPREMVFAQIATYIHLQNYYVDLIKLKSTVNDATKENIITQWLDNFKKHHSAICELAENDYEANYIIIINLLNNFPLELYLDKEIPTSEPHKVWARERFHPYRIRKVINTSETQPNPEYTKYIKIIKKIQDICTRGLHIYFNEWKNDPEEYFKIINKDFSVEAYYS